MKAWLAQSGLDGRYLLLWFFFAFPLFLLSLLTPASFWSGLPLLMVLGYASLVAVGFPIWALICRYARESECNERLVALLASWAAIFSGSFIVARFRDVSGGRFSWQGLLQTAVGFGFLGMVVMSIAVPRMFDAVDDAERGLGK